MSERSGASPAGLLRRRYRIALGLTVAVLVLRQLLYLGSVPAAAHAADLVNRSGLQRMRSQRITKDVLALAAGVDRRAELAQTLGDWRATNADLGDATLGVASVPYGETARARLESVQRTFREMAGTAEDLLDGRMTASLAGKRLLDREPAFLAGMHAVVLALVEAAERSQRDTTRMAWVTMTLVGALLYVLHAVVFMPAAAAVEAMFARERAQAEAAVRREAFVRTVVDAVPDAVVTTGTDGVVRDVNRAAPSLFGAARGELVGRPVADLLGGGEPALDTTAAARGRVYDMAARRSDGRTVPAEVHVADTGADAGEPLRVYVVRDIDERRTVEAARARSEARWRDVFEHSGDAMFTLDALGTISVPNAAARAMFGERLAGRSLLELVVEGDRDKLRAELALMTDRRAAVVAVAMHAADGRTMDVEGVVTTYPGGEGTAGLQAVLRDVSRRREVERMKNEFVSIVSHELRTPLTSVRGSLGLLENGVMGELPAEAVELVRVARTNADRLIRLINDMLDLDKIEAGRMALDKTLIDAGELARAAVRATEGVGAARGVRVRVTTPPSAVIVADRDRITQVLVNYLSNAVKFSPDGGEVRVIVSLERTRVRVTVEDDGPGIPPEKRAGLFGKFHQVDADTARAKTGTGLGLAISRAIVARHGGEVGAISVPERPIGAAFWFDLPRPILGDSNLAIPAGDGRRFEVLLVEDDDDLPRVLQPLLVEAGYTLIHASGIAAAREAVARRRPDAVLLDLNLPDGDGRTFAAALRADPATATIPIIVLTGSDNRQAGAAVSGEWLVKPAVPEALLSGLRRAIRPPGPATVLVADDDEATRRVLRALIESLGARVVEAVDGLAAVDAARRLRPDLIVLDVGLPLFDGRQVVDTLRREPVRNTPLVVYSALDLNPEDRRRLTLGPTRWLTKSRVDNDALVALVRDALGGLLPESPPPRGALSSSTVPHAGHPGA